MPAEYTHAQTVKQQNLAVAAGVILVAGVPNIVQPWVANARAAQQIRFLASITNTGANPVTSVTIRGSNVAAGLQPYSETVLLPVQPGDTGFFEAPGPCPEFYQLEATSLLGTTIAHGRSEVFIVQS